MKPAAAIVTRRVGLSLPAWIRVFCLASLVAAGGRGLAAGAAGSARPNPAVFKLRVGDDPRWAQPDWDDRDWAEVPRPAAGQVYSRIGRDPGLPTQRGIYWIRFTVERSNRRASQPGVAPWVWGPDEPGRPIDSVFLAAIFSFECYWDGQLIGRSGVVGSDRASEVAGRLDNLMRIPDDARGPGPHVVAMRISSYHYNFPAPTIIIGLYFDNYAERFAYEMRRPLLPLIFAGCAVLVAVICGILFGFVERRRTLCLGGSLSLLIAIFYTAIASRWLHEESYDWLYRRYLGVALVAALISILLPWLLLELFPPPRRRIGWAVLALLLGAMWLVSPIYQTKVLWLFRGALGFSLAIAGWAAWRRQTGAGLALAALAMGLASVRPAEDVRIVLAPSFFLFFALLVFALFVALGLQMSADRRRSREAALANARLEAELLKRNIQPHFLINTLSTIMELIEQEPRSAVTMIAALSEEFHILGRVAGEKLISLAEELELCRAHLRMMSLRRSVAYALETRGVDLARRVPPALFHTLVEGGVTHQLPRGGEVRFVLEADHPPGLVRYTLTVEGDNPAASASPRDGTGLRYVKARLEESFGGRWSLFAGPVAAGWQTVIEIQAGKPGA